jgi:hypothetical protein
MPKQKKTDHAADAEIELIEDDGEQDVLPSSLFGYGPKVKHHDLIRQEYDQIQKDWDEFGYN